MHTPAVPGNAASELFTTIINMETPTKLNELRQCPRKTRASEIRKLFKQLGIKGVSVTTPNYSMASTVEISLPDAVEHDTSIELNGDTHRGGCPLCDERWKATRQIAWIILGAFPDLDDRSDSQTDYFDSCLSIH